MTARANRSSRRQDIVLAALRVLGRDGADGFSASVLAAEAGVSKANVFHHFPSLDAVVLEAFETIFAEAELFPSAKDLTMTDWLNVVGDGLFTQIAQQRGLLAVYFVIANRALADPEWNKRIRSHIDRLRSGLEVRLADFPDFGDASRRQALADALFFSLDGVAFHALIAPERIAELRAGWTLLVEALCTTPGEDT